MELSDNLLCLFSSEIDHGDGSYTIEIPEREVELGDLEPDISYRIAMVPQARKQTNADTDTGEGRRKRPLSPTRPSRKVITEPSRSKQSATKAMESHESNGAT